MKKLLVVMIAALILAIGLVGCGSSSSGGSSASAGSAEASGSTTTAGSATATVATSSSAASTSNAQKPDTSARKPLELKESGYSVSSSGYIHWGATIENPNSDWGAQFPKINIVGKSEDGKILFSDSQTLKDIYPNESISYGTQAGNGNVPATVEFTVTVDDNKWVATTEKRDGLYTIENLNDAGSNYGMSHFTGEITLNKEVKGASKPAITLFLRDDSGKIVYGDTTFQRSDLSVGTPAAFEITSSGVPDGYTTMEVHAIPWM